MRYLVMILMMVFAGCGTNVNVSSNTNPADLVFVVSSPTELEKHVNQKVICEGTASNHLKGGTRLILSEDSFVYVRLDGFADFPKSIEGKTIRVTGIVERLEGLDQSEMVKTGIMKQGVVGTYYSLKDVSWVVVK